MVAKDVLHEMVHSAHRSQRNESFSGSTVTDLCLISNHLQLQANGTADIGMPTTSHPTREPEHSSGTCKSPMLPYPTVQRQPVFTAITWKFTNPFSVFRTCIKTFVSRRLLVPNKVRCHTVISAYQRSHQGLRSPCFQ